MTFERERDIPKLRSGTYRDRHALRERARTEDPTIRQLEVLGMVLTGFVFLITEWIVRAMETDSLLIWFCVFGVLLYPLTVLYRGFFIIPRIRRVLTATHEDIEI